jgi:hypothetical protein
VEAQYPFCIPRRRAGIVRFGGQIDTAKILERVAEASSKDWGKKCPVVVSISQRRAM